MVQQRKRGETNFGNDFKAACEAYGACAHKMHGNMYQAGIPDWLISYAGKNVLVELKYSEKSLRSSNQLIAMLRPAQHGVMITITQTQAPIFVALKVKRYGDGPGYAFCTYSLKKGESNLHYYTSIPIMLEDLLG